jgi:hypothetical protein
MPVASIAILAWPDPIVVTVVVTPLLQVSEPSTNDVAATVAIVESSGPSVTVTSAGGACVSPIVSEAFAPGVSSSCHGLANTCSDSRSTTKNAPNDAPPQSSTTPYSPVIRTAAVGNAIIHAERGERRRVARRRPRELGSDVSGGQISTGAVQPHANATHAALNAACPSPMRARPSSARSAPRSRGGT